jgi:hypothetical protein
MQRHWTELLREQRNGLTVVVDKSWEDIPLDHLFDTSVDPDTGQPYHDVKAMAEQIDRGDLDYFMLRARVMYNEMELGSHIVGGFLYEDARDTLTDGMAEDLIYQAEQEAKAELPELIQGLLSVDLDKLAQ